MKYFAETKSGRIVELTDIKFVENRSKREGHSSYPLSDIQRDKTKTPLDHGGFLGMLRYIENQRYQSRPFILKKLSFFYYRLYYGKRFLRTYSIVQVWCEEWQ